MSLSFANLEMVPDDIKEKLKLRGHVDGNIFFAGQYDTNAYTVTFIDVLLETSERADGILLREQWTFLPYLTYSRPDHKWMLRPVGEEELL